MDLDLFDYALPAERIAQEPAADRTAARLMRLDRATGAIEHRTIGELAAILRPGDLLVLNDTAVVPAKLALRRASGGRVGGLFLREADETDGAGGLRWLLLLNGRGRLRVGETLAPEDAGDVTLTIERRVEAGQWEASVRGAGGDTMAVLSRIGQTPLPPYIRRRADRPTDRERYQTVFARRPGAVAAPTAGLHFTGPLLAGLASAGIDNAQVTLHVGLGTFEPVRARQIEHHRMHGEWFDCPAATAEAVNAARSAGRRVVAVGTTSVRVLESCVDEQTSGTAALGCDRNQDQPPSGVIRPRSGWTDLFIFPGCRFRAVDAMLTNFHLPRSSLLMLVAAFAGRERVLAAYRQAIEAGYRFYSYGDAMLIE